MCQWCIAELGMRQVSSHRRGLGLPPELDNPWTAPILWQEGVTDLSDVPPPLTAACLALEAARALGTVRARSLSVRDAAAMLWSHVEMSAAADRDGVAYAQATQRASASRWLARLWEAWLVIVGAPARPDLRRLVQAICTTPPVLDDEMVGLWLQRRAALAWCEADGFGALLDAYGVTVPPFLVHCVALRRAPDAASRRRLEDLAARHHQDLDWVLP